MMKRKILAVVLPIVGCATVVGSGFGAWYFGTVVNPGAQDFEININVTNEVNNGALTITDSNSAKFESRALVLDQGGQSNKENKNAGIMIGASTDTEVTETDGNDWTFKIHYNSADTEGVATIPELYTAKYEIRFTVTITLTDALSQYVQLTPNAEGTAYSSAVSITSTNPSVNDSKVFVTNDSGKNWIAQYVVNPAAYTDINSCTWDFTLAMDTNDSFVNELFTFKQKPTDHPSYLAMADALGSNQSVTFKVEASILPNATGSN